MKQPEEALERLLIRARCLKQHLGPILYQLPPNWNLNLERLEQFLNTLPGDCNHVIEFRNRDWLTQKVYDLLDEHGVGLCVHNMLPRHPRRVTGRVGYIRFHGSGQHYGGSYRTSRLRSWADWIGDVAADHDVFAYFNNDENAYAVGNANRLREMLGVSLYPYR